MRLDCSRAGGSWKGKRRTAAFISALFAMSVVLAACSSSPSPSSEKHFVGSVSIQDYPGLVQNLLQHVAQKEGFFRQNGVNVTFIPLSSGPAGISALASGSVDLNVNDTDFFLESVAKGQKLEMISGVWGQIFTLMGRQGLALPNQSKGWRGVVADLKGRTVGVSALGSGTQYAIEELLALDGLSPTSYLTFVGVGGTSGQIAALQTGKVDTVVEALEHEGQINALGAGSPVINMQAGQGPPQLQALTGCYAGVFGEQSWVNSHPAVVKAFVNSEQEAYSWARDPKHSAQLTQIALTEDPLAGVSDPTAVMANYLKGAEYRVTFNSSSSCLPKWNNLLVSLHLLQAPVSLRGLVWSGTPH